MLKRVAQYLALLAVIAAFQTFARTASASGTTTIYYWNWEAGTSTGGSLVGAIGKVNSDGTGSAWLVDYGLISQSIPEWSSDLYDPHPSYALHGGKRWFTYMLWKYTTYPYWTSAVLFASDAGTFFVLPVDPDIDNQSIVQEPVRWGPGDAEVTFAARSTTTGIVGIYGMPVSFDASGNPSLGPAHLRVPTGSYLETFENVPMFVSVVGDFDWNPSGTAIVFRPDTSDTVNPLADGLYTADSSGNQRQIYSGAVWGSFRGAGLDSGYGVWGPSNKIAYATPDGSLRTVNPDGTGVKQVLASTRSVQSGKPQWSPDGTKLTFVKGTTSGKRTNWEFDIIGSAGGAASTLISTIQIGSHGYPIGWR